MEKSPVDGLAACSLDQQSFVRLPAVSPSHVVAEMGITLGEAAFRRKSRARSRPSFAARRDEAVWPVSEYRQ